MPDTVQLEISGDVSPSQLADLTRELARDLHRTDDLDAELPSMAPAPGERGDAVTLGQIVMTFLTAGAATSLIACLKAYIQRQPTLKFSVKFADGTSVHVDAKGLKDERLKQTIGSLTNVQRGH